jgi:tol-pal system protein YbgF
MPTMKWMKGWIILGVGLFLSGCATTQDARILDGELRRLDAKVNALQKEKDALAKELAKELAVSRMDTSAESKKIQGDLLLRLGNLESDIRVLSTSVEEYKELLRRPSKEIDRVREDIALRTKLLEERGKAFEEKNRAQEDRTKAIEERIRGMEDRFKALEGKIDSVASKQVEMEKSVSTREASEMKGPGTGIGDSYKEAFEVFQKGDLEGARRKFEAFLKQYPNTELSDNAQFWIGETHFLKKDFEKAILEYEKVIVKYPEGDKVPAALLKQGFAFLELGDKTNARNLLKRVIDRYPQSDQAEIARKRLETIK